MGQDWGIKHSHTALKRDDAELWIEALRKEIVMLMTRKTLEPVISDGLTLKRPANDEIDKYNAHRCA